MLHCFSRRRLSRYLCRVRRALATPFEAIRSRARPCDDIAGGIRHRNDGIVERRLEGRPAARDVLAIPTTNSRLPFTAPSLLCHSYLAPRLAQRAIAPFLAAAPASSFV